MNNHLPIVISTQKKIMINNEIKQKINVYQPWSAPLLHTSLPDKLLQELIQLTDIITRDNEREPHGFGLAGEIEDEWTIDPILLINIKFKDYISRLCERYFSIMKSQYYIGETGIPKSILRMKEIIETIEIVQSWFNEQKDNEFNPVHNHGGYISGVLYLKIPKYIPKSI